MAREEIIIEPQEGFQTDFLSTPVDVCIGGGGAGVGKTFAALMESLRHIDDGRVRVTIARRTRPEIIKSGGLWDEAGELFPLFGGTPNQQALSYTFPSGAKVKFDSIQYEKDLSKYQSSQHDVFIFDEICHFTKKMILYIFSRMRSKSMIIPYVRGTCNPDADSFVREMIDWWVGPEGFIIKERCGVIRYFTVEKGKLVWGDTKREVIEQCPDKFKKLAEKGINVIDEVKSFTFLEGDVYQNKKMLEVNPGYIGSLMSLEEEDQLRLLDQNWNIKIGDESIFNSTKYKDCFTNDFVKYGEKYLTADIALEGSDLFVLFV